MNQDSRLALAFVVLMAVSFALLFERVFVVPGAFLYIEIGRYVGPITGLITIVLVLILALVIPGRALSHFENLMTKREFSQLIKRKRKKIIELAIVSLLISFSVVSVLSLAFISTVLQSSRRIDAFVAHNANETLPNYVANLTTFLNDNLKSCYDKPELLFKIDEYASSSLLGSWVMKISNVDRAEVILYQVGEPVDKPPYYCKR
jgi:hypothetical protein